MTLPINHINKSVYNVIKEGREYLTSLRVYIHVYIQVYDVLNVCLE